MSDPTPLNLVVHAVDQLGEDMNRRFDDLGRELGEVKRHTAATNGRVGKLELWQARVQAVQGAYRWIGPVLTSLFAGSGGTVVVLAVTHHL